MPTRIGPKRPRKLYIVQWREHRRLTQKQLAERVGVTPMTISRWENSLSHLNTPTHQALAEALDTDPIKLYELPPEAGRPERPSLDAKVADLPDEMVQEAADLIDILRRRIAG